MKIEKKMDTAKLNRATHEEKSGGFKHSDNKNTPDFFDV